KTTADALLRCADRLANQGKTKPANEIYLKIRNTVEQSPIRLAAIQGQIATAGEASPALILDVLASDDVRARQVATGFVSKLPKSSLPRLLAGIDKLPIQSQSQLIMALGNRHASSAVEIVRKGIESENPDFRTACLTALGNIGNSDDVDYLFEIMRTSEADYSVALKSLGELRDDKVNGVLVDRLAAANSDEERLNCIALLNHRRAVSAVPELLRQAESENNDVRRRAVSSLSRLASANDVTSLIGIHGNSSPEERDSIEKAIVSVCQRIASDDGKSDPLLKAYETANQETRVRILHILGRIGGSSARQAIERALSSKDAEVYDAAVNAFANWPDGAVSQQLLEIAKNGRSEAQRIRALRSLARVCVLSSPEREDLQRLDFLTQAMKLATRPDEIDLIIDRAKAVRTVETLRFVAPYLNDPRHQNRTIQTVLAIAHHKDVREPNRDEFELALKKILGLTDDANLLEKAKQYLENR
ncbi:MAG: HEAT repeat protein, partial [Mariniblastus sp.]